MTASESGYGWSSDRAPHSCGYLAPVVSELLLSLGAKRIIDLGSGNGQLCSILKGACSAHVAGVEVDAKGVAIARSTFPDIPFYQQSLADGAATILDAESELFDAAVATEVIEHLFRPSDLPSLAKQLLVPDGHLIITTPYHGYLKNLALSITNHWDAHHDPLWDGGHIKFWSRKTLTRLLEDNGFEVTHVTGAGRLPYLWKSMIVTTRVSGGSR